jgi:uncharacterized protein
MKRFLISFTIFIILILSIVKPQIIEERHVRLYLPAIEKIDEKERGVLAILDIYVKKGNGHIFIDTMPLTEVDTQSSARIAREVVSSLLDIDPEEYDLFFVIKSNAPIVGGPSAGASMAVGLLAAMLNLSLRNDVIMSGTINIDGTIGQVGGILEKAHAAALHNFSLFLIPKGQRNYNGIDVINYGKEKWNITIIEVENVRDALKYFTGFEIKTKKYEFKENEEVKKAMREIAEKYIEEVEKRIENVEKRIKKLVLDYSEENSIRSLINIQKEKLNETKKLFDKGRYYSSSSYSFSIGIEIAYIENLLDFLEINRKKSVIENKLKNIESLLINLTDKIEREKEKMDSISDIEIISISEDRLSDCENNLKEAWKHFYNSRYEDSIRYLSYAQERAKTVERWLSISNRFVEVKIDFNFSKLKQIIEKDISEIVSHMGYASIMGIDVTNIKDSLEKAKEYLEYGKYSSSLFKLVSTKSEIDVNMILESKTNKTKDFLNEVKNDASKKISEAFRKGIIPVLALNYYEYGETLEEKDLKAALSYFVSAKNFAKNSIKIFETYQGKELMETEKNVEILPYEGEKCKEEYIVLSFAFGALTSFIFLFFFKSYKRKRNKNFSFF